jgi:hypothetical protein
MEEFFFQMHNFIDNPQMMLESSNRLPQENLQEEKSSYVAKWVWNCPSEGMLSSNLHVPQRQST